MNKRYIVRLTAADRTYLEGIVSKGQSSARKIIHAQILLKVDEAGPRWIDERAAEAFGVHTTTVRTVRERFVNEGLESALNRKPQVQPSRYRTLDGAGEAQLIAIACGKPPEGQVRWTLRLLANRLVELQVVDTICHETVRQTLKNELKPHRSQYWCIPPEQSAEFVASMEDVLELYQQPLDPKQPVVCMDETSKQLVAELKLPIPVSAGRAQRIDYEYERKGTADVFIFAEPLRGWRWASVTERRTRIDWAYQVRTLIDVHYPKADVIRLVMDNLNTHSIASLYEAFHPTEARRLSEKLEIHYTPKHGSWLNIAEIELKALSTQCMSRRIPTIDVLRREVAAWESERNRRVVGVDWQFTTDKARIKLKRLYPVIRS